MLRYSTIFLTVRVLHQHGEPLISGRRIPCQGQYKALGLLIDFDKTLKALPLPAARILGRLAATPSTGEPPESAVAPSDQAAFDDVVAAGIKAPRDVSLTGLIQ